MKQKGKGDNKSETADVDIWETEDKFILRTGAAFQLDRYRAANPGLWRINDKGKFIYSVFGWMKFSIGRVG